MGETFILEHPPVPLPVRSTNTRGLLSERVHLTDDRHKTLCGQTTSLVLVDKGTKASCKTCLAAVDGWARIKREIR